MLGEDTFASGVIQPFNTRIEREILDRISIMNFLRDSEKVLNRTSDKYQ